MYLQKVCKKHYLHLMMKGVIKVILKVNLGIETQDFFH